MKRARHGAWIASSSPKQSLVKAREDVVESLVRPIRTRVERNLLRLSGPGFVEVHFGVEFVPKAVKPDEGDIAVGLEAIVLDDPLVQTDAARMSRAAPLLEEAAERCPILEFTCYSEGYRGLRGAREFDLAAIRSELPPKR